MQPVNNCFHLWQMSLGRFVMLWRWNRYNYLLPQKTLSTNYSQLKGVRMVFAFVLFTWWAISTQRSWFLKASDSGSLLQGICIYPTHQPCWALCCTNLKAKHEKKVEIHGEIQSCEGQRKTCCGTWKDRTLWVFFREKFCNYLALIIVWHFWAVFYRSGALTEPKAFGGENKLPHRQKNLCNSPGEFTLRKKPMKKIPLPCPQAGNKGNRIGHISGCDLSLGNVSPQDCMNHGNQTAKSIVNISAPSISLCRCPGEPHVLPPPGALSTSPVMSCSKLRPCWNQWTWFFAGLGFQQKQPQQGVATRPHTYPNPSRHWLQP